MEETLTKIKEQVESNAVIIYMKGSPSMPMCGFSSRAADALKSADREFAFVNVIANPDIFEHLPKFADWPTFPQIYIDGELIGGCDIVVEMAEKGELQPMVQQAVDARAG